MCRSGSIPWLNPTVETVPPPSVPQFVICDLRSHIRKHLLVLDTALTGSEVCELRLHDDAQGA